jgi:hypothetical protein
MPNFPKPLEEEQRQMQAAQSDAFVVLLGV